MQGAWVWSLVRELRSCILRCMAKKKKKIKGIKVHPLPPSKELVFLRVYCFLPKQFLLWKDALNCLQNTYGKWPFCFLSGLKWGPIGLENRLWRFTVVTGASPQLSNLCPGNLLTHSLLFCSVLNPRKKMKCPTTRLWTKWLLDERRNLIFLW